VSFVPGFECSIPSKDELLRMFEVKGENHPLHTHPYLDDFVFKVDDLGLVRRFVEVLYTFCECFHTCLWALGLSAPDETIRRAIADNLHSEYGAGVQDRGHLVLMRRLIGFFGYNQETVKAICLNQGATRFMGEIVRLCREDHPLKAAGCILIGAECNGAMYFRKIHSAFQKKACLRGADLHILEIHAGDDVEHRAAMLALIDPYLDDPQNRRLLLEGFNASIRLFCQLWDSMAHAEGILA